jgi:hypothetical protein
VYQTNFSLFLFDKTQVDKNYFQDGSVARHQAVSLKCAEQWDERALATKNVKQLVRELQQKC